MFDIQEARNALSQIIKKYDKVEDLVTQQLIPGMPVCNKCRKGNFIKTTRQTRSADEGMTLIEICNFCGYKK